MERQYILDKIKEIVHECVPEIEKFIFSESTVISTFAGMNSMGFALSICRIEETFKIEIPMREWNNLYTVKDVADAVERYSES